MIDRNRLALEFVKILIPEVNCKDYKAVAVAEAFELADIFIEASKNNLLMQL